MQLLAPAHHGRQRRTAYNTGCGRTCSVFASIHAARSHIGGHMRHDPLHPHAHDPNLETPAGDGRFVLSRPGHAPLTLTPQDLAALPQTSLPGCFIVSTGHGTSGPFTFSGVTLRDLLRHYLPAGEGYAHLEIISTDAFGTRVWADELHPGRDHPILLATHRDTLPLTRDQGLVRLIVPSETDDALRQVKWISHIHCIAP